MNKIEKKNIPVLVMTSEKYKGGYYAPVEDYPSLWKKIVKIKDGEQITIRKTKVSKEFLDFCAKA